MLAAQLALNAVALGAANALVAIGFVLVLNARFFSFWKRAFLRLAASAVARPIESAPVTASGGAKFQRSDACACSASSATQIAVIQGLIDRL